MRWLGVLIAVVPTTARADEKTIAVVEALIPDARREYSFTEKEAGWVLSLPVAWHATYAKLGTKTALGFIHVVEGQWQASKNEWRGLLGERMAFDFGGRYGELAPIVEVSGLLGTDGYGVVFGTGLTWGIGAAGITMGLIGRYVITNNEHRMDVALDFMLPLNMLRELAMIGPP